ncbi:ATPase [Labrys sp. WJW]|uniref:SRPBCC family protein n=1 Tax=Labrys sp. WJW TaxID=1737983 RepID=UPI0008364A07|nr:SRPBCC family protein [Labrys sp. WJW]OCC05534.1 ATPase [Labrys sp. WJW]
MEHHQTTRRTDAAALVIAASPQTIYRAFTDPEAWLHWLPPEGMIGHIYQFDARPGGAYRMALTYCDNDHPSAGKTSDATDIVEGRFVELVPNERVVQLVTFESADPAFAGEMRMTWRLMPRQGGTEVSITAENVPMGIRKDDHDAGLRSTLENLARFVAQPV